MRWRATSEKAWVRGEHYHREGSEGMTTVCGMHMGGVDKLMLLTLAQARATPCPACYPQKA